MSSHSATPDSGRGQTVRHRVGPFDGTPYIPEREIEAYLLARDTLRRIQRTSPLVEPVLPQTREADSPHQAGNSVIPGL